MELAVQQLPGPSERPWIGKEAFESDFAAPRLAGRRSPPSSYCIGSYLLARLQHLLRLLPFQDSSDRQSGIPLSSKAHRCARANSQLATHRQSMALNWVTLDQDGRSPLPLPDETVLCRVPKSSIQLEYASRGITYKAEGSALISSHRFVFIRDAPSAAAEHELKSLSIPIDHLAASKYTIPIFSAPYLQADVYSVAQGGLPERQPGEEAHPVGKLKLWFVEAGGVAFRDAIEKARHMWQQNRQQQLDQDALPAYEPSAS
ncbi:uncharacterized protein PAN0_005d2723 [Moesziomyces antarcticus]|uniref:GRAM domain-containing protein n=2 Tax=Pseudozyma antarctica TaxID=84753 RepID=A0A081CCW3_PSEA2|nr:uncharacterized protein PAN0_005d2723 [Moesziomyces antarcticus]GAK64509.1 conserved hypothetical protein [Moesziomyces antarcticus]